MYSGFDIDALDRCRKNMRQAGAATLLALVGLALFIPAAPGLIAPMGVTAAICALATVWLRDSYLEMVERFATNSNAYSIPAVSAFGERLVTLAERRRLAALIDSITSPIGPEHALASSDRLAAYGSDLREIACELRDGGKTPRPTTMASCRRLLVRAAESPLYNERIPIEELDTALRHIRFGLAASAAA